MKNSVKSEDPRRSRNDVGNTYSKYYTTSVAANKYLQQHQKVHPPNGGRQSFAQQDKNSYYNRTLEPVAPSDYAYDPKIQWAIEKGYIRRPEVRSPNPRPAPLPNNYVYLTPSSKALHLQGSNVNLSGVVPFLCIPKSTSRETDKKSQVLIDPKLKRFEGEKGAQMFRELIRSVRYKKMLEREIAAPKTLPSLTYGEPKGGSTASRSEHYSKCQEKYEESEKYSGHDLEARTSITTNSIEILEEEVEEEEITYETENVKELAPFKTDDNYEEEQIVEEDLTPPVSNYDTKPRVPKHPPHVFISNPPYTQPPTNKIPQNFLHSQVNYCVRNPQTPIRPFQHPIDTYKNLLPKMTPHPTPEDAAKFAYSAAAADPVWSRKNYYKDNIKSDPRVGIPLQENFDADLCEFQPPLAVSKRPEHLSNMSRYHQENIRIPNVPRILKHYNNEEQEEVDHHKRVGTYQQFDDYSNVSVQQKSYYDPRSPKNVAHKPQKINNTGSNDDFLKTINAPQKPRVITNTCPDDSSPVLTQQSYVTNNRRPQITPPRSENIAQRQNDVNSRRTVEENSPRLVNPPPYKSNDVSSKSYGDPTCESQDIDYKHPDDGFTTPPNSIHQPQGIDDKHSNHSSISPVSSVFNPHDIDSGCSDDSFAKSANLTCKFNDDKCFDDNSSRSINLAAEPHDTDGKPFDNSSSKLINPPEISSKHLLSSANPEFKPNVVNNSEDGSSKRIKPISTPREIDGKPSDHGSSKSTNLQEVKSKHSSKSAKTALKSRAAKKKCSEGGSSTSTNPTHKAHDIESKFSDDSSCKSSLSRYKQNFVKRKRSENKTKGSPHSENKLSDESESKPAKPGYKSRGDKRSDDNSSRSTNPEHKPPDINSKRSDDSSSKSVTPAKKPKNKRLENSISKSTNQAPKPHNVTNNRTEDSNQNSEKMDKTPKSFKHKLIPEKKIQSSSVESEEEKSKFTQKKASVKKKSSASNEAVASPAVTKKEFVKKSPQKALKEKEKVQTENKLEAKPVLPISKPSKIPKALTRPKTAPGAIPQWILKKEKTEIATGTSDNESSMAFESCGICADHQVQSEAKETIMQSSTATVETITAIPAFTETLSSSNLPKESSCNKNEKKSDRLPTSALKDPPVSETKRESGCDINVIMEKIKEFQKTLEKHQIAPHTTASSSLKPVPISLKKSENNEHAFHTDQKLIFRVTASQRTMNTENETKITKTSSSNLDAAETKDQKEPTDGKYFNHRQIVQREISRRVINLNKMQSVSAEISRQIIELDQKHPEKTFPAEKRQPFSEELARKGVDLDEQLQISPEVSQKVIDLDEQPQSESPLMSEANIGINQNQLILQTSSQTVMSTDSRQPIIIPKLSTKSIKRPESPKNKQRSEQNDGDINNQSSIIDRKRPESPKNKQRRDSTSQIEEVTRPESPRNKHRHENGNEVVDNRREANNSDQQRPESPRTQLRRGTTDHIEEIDQRTSKLDGKRPDSPRNKHRFDSDQFEDISKESSNRCDQQRPESPRNRERSEDINQVEEIDRRRPDSPRNKHTFDSNDQIGNVSRNASRRPESPKNKKITDNTCDQIGESTIDTLQVKERRSKSPRSEGRHDDNDLDQKVSRETCKLDRKRSEPPKNNYKLDSKDHIEDISKEVSKFDVRRPKSPKEKDRFDDYDDKESCKYDQARPESPKDRQRSDDQKVNTNLDICQIHQNRPAPPKHDDNEQLNELDRSRPNSPKNKHKFDYDEKIEEIKRKDQKRPESPKHKQRVYNDEQINEIVGEASRHDRKRSKSPKHKRKHDNDDQVGDLSGSSSKYDRKRPESPKHKRKVSISDEMGEIRKKDEEGVERVCSQTQLREVENESIKVDQPGAPKINHISINRDQEQLVSRITQRVADPNQQEELLSEISRRVKKIDQRQGAFPKIYQKTMDVHLLKLTIPDATQTLPDFNQREPAPSHVSQRSSKDDQRQPLFIQMNQRKSGGVNQKPQVSGEFDQSQIDDAKDVSKEIIQVHKREPTKTKKPKKAERLKTDDKLKNESLKLSCSKNSAIRNPSKKFVESRYEKFGAVSSSSCSDYALNRRNSPTRTSRASSPIVCKIRTDKSSAKSQTTNLAREKSPKSSIKSKLISRPGSEGIKPCKTEHSLKHRLSRPRTPLTFADDVINKQDNLQKHAKDHETAGTSSRHEHKDKQKAKMKKRSTSKEVRRPSESLVQTFYRYCIAILAFFKNYPCKYILKYLLFL